MANRVEKPQTGAASVGGVVGALFPILQASLASNRSHHHGMRTAIPEKRFPGAIAQGALLVVPEANAAQGRHDADLF